MYSKKLKKDDDKRYTERSLHKIQAVLSVTKRL
jgi:hypothetical protein